jgi:DNA-binding transcriptional ArsR family regulator
MTQIVHDCTAAYSKLAPESSADQPYSIRAVPNTEHRSGYSVLMAPTGLEAAEIFTEVVEGLGLSVVGDNNLDRPDMVLLDIDGRYMLVELKRTSMPTPLQVSDLAADEGPRARPDVLHVLVADRIPEASREELRRHGWGWLDLRGHLHLAGHGVLVDIDVPPVKARAERIDAFSGSAGLEVACALLLEPGVEYGVRGLARSLDRSPSTVSEVLSALRGQGLVSTDGSPVLPDLFWETADAWRPREVPLAELPRPGEGSVTTALRLGLDDVETQPGWALTGTLAAAIYGAPVAARSDYPPDFYVPESATLRRATRLLGMAVDADHRRATVRVAPVPAVCERRVDPVAPSAKAWAFTNEHWPLANPLFVALDLARDPGRGREILDNWQPPRPWRRVW